MTPEATPTVPETIVLEIIDALGGRAQYMSINGMIRKQLRPYLRAILGPMVERGWVERSFMGQYALTAEGRAALAVIRSVAA